MYGLVNKAIKDMICNYYGENSWENIKQKAELEVDTFLSMEGYPDDLTHSLIKATSEVLGLSASEIMQAFGEYWIKYTAQEGYGEMMEMSGENLPDFLDNLDNLHARVGIIFPQLKPPSFNCTHQKESLTLHYHSSRKGFAAMVLGLVKGLGKRFNTEIEVNHTRHQDENADGDEFLIEYKPNSQKE